MDPKLKIISDHLRSSCFLIADGIMPSNEGRGYVLRRIMRRAMLQIHKLGAKQALMYKLVDPLTKEMGQAYPELVKAQDTIKDILKNEEEKFGETIGKGLKILNEELGKNPNQKTFSGKTAFKLYDTFGFPLDLTQDILKDKKIEIDIAEFDKEMTNQKEMARKNWSGSGEESQDKIFFELKKQFGATKFLGYETTSSKAKILHINQNDNPFLVLDQTPFYATSGGQKGDEGRISLNEKTYLEVIETKKFANDLFVHFVKKSESLNKFKIESGVTAFVNEKSRNEKEANHSATHLMHKALKEILGNSISQKGSNVDSKYLTFDFNFNRQMTDDEKKKVEDIVNKYIQESHPSKTTLMDLEEAKESGAEALFGEKYDEKVRVVKIGDCVELCGGTHVKNSSEIKAFKILSEKSVASGIRRIEAKTGKPLEEYLKQAKDERIKEANNLITKITLKNQEISKLTNKEIQQDHESETDPKLLEEILRKKDKEIEKIKKQSLLSNLDDLNKEQISNITLISHTFEDCEAKDLREIANQLLAIPQNKTDTIVNIFATNNGKVAVCCAMSQDLTQQFDATILVKLAVEEVGGKGGGGKKDLAMGGGANKDGIENATAKVKNEISNSFLLR